MIRIGCKLSLVCLLSCTLTIPAQAGGNALLLPPPASRCLLELPPDEGLAERLRQCQDAALAGDAQSAYELGLFYYLGQWTARDWGQAVRWFEQASFRGHPQAQHRLGLMFFQGEGVSASNVQAYILLKMAAVNGDEQALDAADRVSARMRPEELERAAQVLSQIFRSSAQEPSAVERP